MGKKRRAYGDNPENSAYEGQGDPLLVALFEQDADGARQLIESNACNIEAADQLGWRPLHRACYAGLDGVVSLLLQRRADPAAADPEGVTPLHVAASRGCAECCRLLVAAGADPAQPDGLGGMTPQLYAMGKEDAVAQQLSEVLGAADLKMLAAWSNPLEMAKLVSEAATDEERSSMEEKFLESLDESTACVPCAGPGVAKAVITDTREGKRSRVDGSTAAEEIAEACDQGVTGADID